MSRRRAAGAEIDAARRRRIARVWDAGDYTSAILRWAEARRELAADGTGGAADRGMTPRRRLDLMKKDMRTLRLWAAANRLKRDPPAAGALTDDGLWEPARPAARA